MGVIKVFDQYTPICDICGEELAIEPTFQDAVCAIEAASWQRVKTDFGWDNYCTRCKKERY